MLTPQDQLRFVFNDPLNDLTALELHRLSHSRWEVDVPLLGAFALDQLNFSRETHFYI
jgi:hypothetical protein